MKIAQTEVISDDESKVTHTGSVSLPTLPYPTLTYPNLVFPILLSLRQGDILDEGVQDEPDPPYSIAFVAVIALNVVVQVVFDSIIFSYLQMDLRSASW